MREFFYQRYKSRASNGLDTLLLVCLADCADGCKILILSIFAVLMARFWAKIRTHVGPCRERKKCKYGP